ncbi:MAG: N-6 DNA methylase [Candidatus Hodarchaeales archaeon]
MDTIRNYLVANTSEITRDETLVEQIIMLIFCKILDEKRTEPYDPVLFQKSYIDNSTLPSRIDSLFNDIKTKYPSLFDDQDSITLDYDSLEFIVTQLEIYAITSIKRETIGDVLESFIGKSIRGHKGQFFTPNNICTLMVGLLNPSEDQSLIDPACGTGRLLLTALEKTRQVYGIEKDKFLVKISNLSLAMAGNFDLPIKCANSLSFDITLENKFDYVIVNPPFGRRIQVKSQEILSNYDFGYEWISSKSNSWTKTERLRNSQASQILFIEKSLQLLKKKGRMAIIVPEGILTNKSDRYVIYYLLQSYKILAVVSCPQSAFLPYTFVKTVILLIENSPPPKEYKIFMAIAENLGQNKDGRNLYVIDNSGKIIVDIKGNKILNDDTQEMLRNFSSFSNGINKFSESKNNFVIKNTDLINNILKPEYYDPTIFNTLTSIDKEKYESINFGDLVRKGIIRVQRGHEVGTKFYDSGEKKGQVAFIRSSDIINWEINLNPIKKVSKEIYKEKYKNKQSLQPGDILFVNDGTYLLGRTAIVTEYDIPLIVQSHIKIIRVLPNDFIDEYLLLWSLNTEIVQMQIKSKIFVQATISTLGDRLNEIQLILPRSSEERLTLSNSIKLAISKKAQIKNELKNLFSYIIL